MTIHHRWGMRALLPISAVVLAATALSVSPAMPGTPETISANVRVAAATAPTGSGLEGDVAALHAAGSIGILAESQVGNDRRFARAGTARIGSGRSVPYHAEFRIGSTTKTFVTTTLLQLVGEGRLSLDDKVDRWLPGLIRGSNNDGSKITVRDILQQTSGIYNYVDDPSIAAGITTAAGYRQIRFHTFRPEQLVAIAMRHRSGPIGAWAYSDTNYVIAGMIIRAVTGHDWADEVTRRILRPLRLRHTYAPGNDPYLAGPHADGYESFPDAHGLTDVTTFNMTAADASGAMISTTTDLNVFWHALMQGRLLNPAQLREMQTTVAVPADFGLGAGAAYGLGMFRVPLSCGGHYWMHPGDAPGFQSISGALPDGSGSLALSTTGPETPTMQNAALLLLDHTLCAASITERGVPGGSAPWKNIAGPDEGGRRPTSRVIPPREAKGS